MESKTELLNEAVSLGDGNAILTVVLFLAKSLKKTLFYQLLRSHTEAVNHYVNYLGTRMQLQEMTDILQVKLSKIILQMKQFSIACQSPQKRLQKLKTCLRNHFAESKDKIFVDNFIKLLEWQQSIGTAELEGKSVIDSLAYTCEHHWNDNKSSATSPYMLAQHHRINRRQFQWVALNALAKNSSWNEIETLLVTKGWLGGKRVNAILPMDQVVIQLHKLKAPNNVLHIYFELIDDIDKRMCVAKKLQCHKEVIDVSV
ncbi:hypothetical protein AAG570_009005 [Ranatra chinensis]|uniref:Vps16 C-terminal domain-containing protein n=1 Tax=Ranatra chinensis TaxID=642074 RepID=A0ABD0Z9K8_9HEMI